MTKMMAKIFDIDIASDLNHPYVVVSPTWGLLAKFHNVEIAKNALAKGIAVPVAHQFLIPSGHIPSDAELFYWRSGRWEKFQ